MTQFDPSSRLPINLQWFAEGDNSQADKGAEAGSDDAGQGSGESNEFLSDLPESLKGSKSLAKFGSKADLAQSYVFLESKLGKSVEIPGKDASPEAWEKFFSRIGRPKTADEYKLTPSAGYRQDPVFDAAFKKAAHLNGLSATAAGNVYAEVTRRMAENESARQAETDGKREKALQALRSQYGDSMDREIAKAKSAYQALFSAETRMFLQGVGAEDHPSVIADLIKAAAAFGNERIVDGRPPAKRQPGQAPKTTDPDHPYAYMREEKS